MRQDAIPAMAGRWNESDGPSVGPRIRMSPSALPVRRTTSGMQVQADVVAAIEPEPVIAQLHAVRGHPSGARAPRLVERTRPDLFVPSLARGVSSGLHAPEEQANEDPRQG